MINLARAIAMLLALSAPGVAFAQCAMGTPSCVSSVTYNGTALALKGTTTSSTVRSEIWYLLAPPSGAHDVLVTLGASADLTAAAISFSGVNQSAPLGAFGSAKGVSTAPSVTFASNTSAAAVDVVGAIGTTAPVAGASQTTRATNNTNAGTKHVVLGSSTRPGLASVTMSWTIPSADWALSATSVLPDAQITGVDFESFVATADENGVLLQWQVGYEPDCAGYYVYRQFAGEDRVQLDDDIISGDAVLGAVGAFSWRDVDGAESDDASYWLKEVALDGSYTWHGPATWAVTPSVTADGTATIAATTATADTTTARDTAASGCAVAARDVTEGLAEALFVAAFFWLQRYRKTRPRLRTAVSYAFVFTIALFSGISAATGGITYDAVATATGTSSITFSHTVGTNADRILIVTVVLPSVDTPLICCDGTDSPTCTCNGPHRGCCSHHGGACGC